MKLKQYRVREFRSRIPLGHAAFFPDVDGFGGLVGPDAPLDIIGGRQDITLISQWVDRGFTYWAGSTTLKNMEWIRRRPAI
jgi:hypothetical protein